MRRGASRCAPAAPAFVYHRVHGLDDVAHTYAAVTVRGTQLAGRRWGRWTGEAMGGHVAGRRGELRRPLRSRAARRRYDICSTRRKSLRASAIFVLRGRIAAVVVIVRRTPPTRRPGAADTAAAPPYPGPRLLCRARPSVRPPPPQCCVSPCIIDVLS